MQGTRYLNSVLVEGSQTALGRLRFLHSHLAGQKRLRYRVDSREINHKGGPNLKPEVAFNSRIGFKDEFDPHLRHLGMNLFAANRERYVSAIRDDIILDLFFSCQCHDVQ